jgi:hypothetical protein
MTHLTVIAATAVVLYFLHQARKSIMATQAELATRLTALLAQNEKAAAEQATAMQALRDELANAGAVTPEVEAALVALEASIAREDDLNPDAPVDPVEPV